MTEVMQVLEGWCSEHESYTKLIKAGGTAAFLEAHGYAAEEGGSLEIRRWRGAPGNSEIGELTFQCEHGHTLSAFALAGGDWAI